MNIQFQPAVTQAQAKSYTNRMLAFSGKPYIAGNLEFDVYNMTPCAVGQKQGVDTTALFRANAQRAKTIVEDIWANKDNPKDFMGWLNLDHQPDDVKAIKQYAQSVKGKFDDVIILGIGGSALGTRAMFEALLPANWNLLSKESRGGYPRYHILDNIDPDHLSESLKAIDLKKTLVNVVSKSGSTAEPMSQYLILKEALQNALGTENYKSHLLFTTDPKAGVLREIANEEKIPTLDIPPSAGGRFSIFSPVGLVPAALLGLPIEDMLKGVTTMNESLKNSDIFKNSAAQAALLEFDALKKGKNMSVLMPYSSKLASVADWYVQLWDESLGKKHNTAGTEVYAGQTAIKAVGATDQHSQMQLYNAGPFDKVVNFIRLKSFKNPLPIPALHMDKPALSYLGGQTIEKLMQSEFEGSRASLNAHQRPNTTLTLPMLDANHFGQLLQFMMFKTAVMSKLLEINGFDQPNVELGKQFTYGLMGRKGFENKLEQVKKLTSSQSA